MKTATASPPRDMTPSVSHPLCIIPFDGKGSDPALLVGHRIQRFQFDAITGGAEFILHTDQGHLTITYSEFSISRYAEIMADKALLEGLESVERIVETWYRGDEEVTRTERGMQEKKRGSLLILQAAAGLRKYPDFGEYRVVGIRCEGMQSMGFVFSEDATLEDHYGRASRLGDVALKLDASKRE